MLNDKIYIEEGQFFDEALKMDPGYGLPENFAEKLAQNFERHFAWNQYFKEFLIYFGTGLGILIASVLMVFFLKSEIWAKWVEIFFMHTTTIIGIVFLLAFILFTDKVLLRYFSFKLNNRNLNI